MGTDKTAPQRGDPVHKGAISFQVVAGGCFELYNAYLVLVPAVPASISATG